MRKIDCPLIGYRQNSCAHIRSIEFRSDCVFFDMALLREKLVELRPWFKLHKNTHLWISETNTRLPLIKFEGIPAVLHAADAKKGILLGIYFPLPENWIELDYVHIIEDEADSPSCINQYKICLTEKAEKGLPHFWNHVSSISEIPDL